MKDSMESPKSSAGFSLVELLVVLAILGILFGLVISRTPLFRQKARDNRRAADIQRLTSSLEEYYSDNHLYPGRAEEYEYSNQPNFFSDLKNQDYLTSNISDPLGSGTYLYSYYLSSDSSNYAICAPLEGEKTGDNIYYHSGSATYYYLSCSNPTFCKWFWAHNGCQAIILPTCAADGDGVTGVCCESDLCDVSQGGVSDCGAGQKCCQTCLLPFCSSLGGKCCPSHRCQAADKLSQARDCQDTEVCCKDCQPPDCNLDLGGLGYTCCPSGASCTDPITPVSGCSLGDQCCKTCSLPTCASKGGTCCRTDLTGYTCSNPIGGATCAQGTCCNTSACVLPCSVAGGTCCNNAGYACSSPITGNCAAGETCCPSASCLETCTHAGGVCCASGTCQSQIPNTTGCGTNVCCSSCTPPFAGDGRDGPITISGTKNINTDNLAFGRTVADGIATTTSVSSSAGSTTMLVNSKAGLAVGDEVLIVNLQGTSGNNADIGKYEFKRLTNIETIVSPGVQEGTTWTTSFSGTVSSNTTWSQNIRLFGDVTVNSGVTLTISPGVTIFFAANSDDRASGAWTNKTEIIVKGTLYAVGTRAQPIYFTSDASTKAKENWGRIYIDSTSVSQIKWAVIHYATEAITQAPYNANYATQIENCNISDNTTGFVARESSGWPTYNYPNVSGWVKNSLFNNNNTGFSLYAGNGYGRSTISVNIENNIIQNSSVDGIYIGHDTWWLGHTYTTAQIKSNSFLTNTSNGIRMHMNGPGDCSGWDSNITSSVTLNYFSGNPAGVRTERGGNSCLTNPAKLAPSITTNTFDSSPGVYVDWGSPKLKNNNFTNNRSNGSGSTLTSSDYPAIGSSQQYRLTFSSPLSNSYDGISQRVMIQRVPNYTNVTIPAGATFTASSWDGSKGGVLVFKANGAINVNGVVSLSGKGYRGASQVGCIGYGCGYRGEGTAGGYQSVRGTSNNNNGGGGGDANWCHSGEGGAGGGNGTAGANGRRFYWNCGGGWACGSTTALGGGIVGESTLNAKLTFGGGGGGGGLDGDNPDCGGSGGTGGGIIAIYGMSLSGSGSIASSGTRLSDSTYETGGGGGGAGGSIRLEVVSNSMNVSQITASGSAGSSGGCEWGCRASGGAGGQGRVVIY